MPARAPMAKDTPTVKSTIVFAPVAGVEAGQLLQSLATPVLALDGENHRMQSGGRATISFPQIRPCSLCSRRRAPRRRALPIVSWRSKALRLAGV
jgi:hypothetical protein